MTRDEATVLYARGGTGKGLVACWIISELVADGQSVLIFDAEGHRREWASRLRGLGLTDEQLQMVHYRSPSSDEWKNPSGYLHEVYPLIRADCDRLGITTIIVDSYTAAASSGAEMGGAAAAYEFFDACKRIGRHSLVLAHNTGASGRFPSRPFGSVHVGNNSREMWAVEKVEVTEEIEYDHDTNPLQPTIVALELRNTKMSERPEEPPQFLTFSFFHDGHIELTRPERHAARIADQIREVLGSETLTATEIVKAIKEDFGDAPKQDSVTRTLRRDSQFAVQDGSARPRRWRLSL